MIWLIQALRAGTYSCAIAMALWIFVAWHTQLQAAWFIAAGNGIFSLISLYFWRVMEKYHDEGG